MKMICILRLKLNGAGEYLLKPSFVISDPSFLVRLHNRIKRRQQYHLKQPWGGYTSVLFLIMSCLQHSAAELRKLNMNIQPIKPEYSTAKILFRCIVDLDYRNNGMNLSHHLYSLRCIPVCALTVT